MVDDSALLTLADLGGIIFQQVCSQQDAEEEQAEDLSDRTQSQTKRGAACSCEEEQEEEEKDEEEDALHSSLGSMAPAAASASTNSSVHQCYKWREDEGAVVLPRGKKDTWEENSEEEEKEEDGEVCRKEAMKVLCNIIYNSSRAQERASALRSANHSHM